MKLSKRMNESILKEIEFVVEQKEDYNTIVLRWMPEEKDLVLESLTSDIIYDILEDYLEKNRG